MKNLNFLLLLLFSFACTRQQIQESQPTEKQLCDGSIPYTFFIPSEDSISIELPTCFRHVPLVGIDSDVGQFMSSEVSLVIYYDIGIAAGYQVKQNSPNKQVFQSVNQEFWYEQINGYVYFTFPNAGPANFYTEDETYATELIEIMKTLKTN
ncbi:MAG: hypothetical protein H7246_21280 [Phycisphaerae bacterium]|nr:hypothetical protein [Saprospiraceae bacterium]